MSSTPSRAGVRCAALLVCCASFATCDVSHAGDNQAAMVPEDLAAEDAPHHVRIDGTAILPNGEPARGAVVVSSAGGLAEVRDDGSFALEIALAREADAVELTAVANGAQGSLLARKQLDGLRDGPSRNAGTLFLALSQGCVADWIPTFGSEPGAAGDVHALAVFDDGSGAGPALYVGGSFGSVEGQSIPHIAKWDGESWSALGSGTNGDIYALAVFDDGLGGGPALFAGGNFSSAGGQPADEIAKWDGEGWSSVGGGMNDRVLALAVLDDGSGAALYAGGEFTQADAIVNHIARWDGKSWSALGSGTNYDVFALAAFDDGLGGGPALYAGGEFKSAGGQPADHIAKWDGQSWSAVGGGTSSNVLALAVFDDGLGDGPALYAGGWFTSAGGQPANRIAKWDGQSWSGLGSGLSHFPYSMAVFDDGSGAGPALYVGGEYLTAGSEVAHYIAKWDGRSWSALPSGLDDYTVLALASFDDGSGSGPALYVAGGISGVPGASQTQDRISKWDGQSWSPLGTGLNDPVHAFAVFDDRRGAGPALYAAGEFTAAGGQAARHVAKWDGQQWHALGSGMNAAVVALAVFDDGLGGGPALYAGGWFTSAGGVSTTGIAKWDGQSWSALSGGMSGAVTALAVFDDGGGPALYAGGHFNTAGGVAAIGIARWDGASWTPLGSGLSPAAGLALTVYDDGGGPDLYVGGGFTTAGGASATGIARWDGQSWSAVSSGTNNVVKALAVFDDGSGPALYAGGEFTIAGGQSASRIARWDGQAWTALGSGVNNDVLALTVFDDGSGAGPALYVGGHFTSAGGQGIGYLARWDGEAWSALSSGVDNHVYALTGFDDGFGAGPALYAGGIFKNSPGGDSLLAKWGCPLIDEMLGCFGNPATLTALSAAASIGDTFSVSLSASRLSAGLGLLFLGLDGTDASGCGVFVPGIGELLLAPSPKPAQVASGSLSAGDIEFSLPVPDAPNLVGVRVVLHGIAIGSFNPGIPIELSNGLLVTITL